MTSELNRMESFRGNRQTFKKKRYLVSQFNTELYARHVESLANRKERTKLCKASIQFLSVSLNHHLLVNLVGFFVGKRDMNYLTFG